MMPTQAAQPFLFHRPAQGLSALLLAGVLSCATLGDVLAQAPVPTAPAAAPLTPRDNGPVPIDNSDRSFAGNPFFLLSDTTYGSADTAKVRLEINAPDSLQEAGGVDVVVYRIKDPLAFLQRQRNLHRVQVEGRAAEPGLASTLTHVWDNLVAKSRLAWRKLFSSDARGTVTQHAPELSTPPDLTKPSTFEQPPQFKPIPGLPIVERFRYPVQVAKPIAPPKDLKLDGSSSNFIKSTQGNVHLPIGKRTPGLYLIEAMAGKYRATTLLFVSDTVAITKVSGEQMLIWAAQRADGKPVEKTRIVWTDGMGVLKSGTTDVQGVVRLDRNSPEQTYVFGEDRQGGVFISENYYYDSEIYATKLYTVTDRPLYRPGDWVNVKITGREFRNARDSVALKDADIALTVLDPAGQVVQTQTLRFSGTQGADTRFALPQNASAGGYELRMAMGDDVYTAAFRVADYQKPHFEILLLTDKPDFALGEKVTGKLQLNYPDGKPVANARVSLTARAQKLTMVEGELDYTGQFPLKLTQDELQTDSKGVAKFTLPAADEPSRYVLSALATDGAAYRVRMSKEILVERSGASYKLTANKLFSKPGESVAFKLSSSTRGLTATTSAETVRPARWEWLRLESREKQTGELAAADTLTLSFPQPGSYTLTLRDERGRIVGAASHWVSGEGAKAPVGSINLVFNRASYRAGDTAELLATFPEPVDEALLTLERDRVEDTAILGRRADWIKSERLTPTQWKLTLPVRETMSPNITVSVAYVKNGDYVFQNQGLLVEQPRIALNFRTDKAVYAPGETVTVDVTTTLGSKPVAADVMVGVVDEMIYVLQPEIAPSIDDFFYHPRRNNVRTSASLSFISYDLATNKLGEQPSRSQVNQRAIKVLERPRRENVDTAAWQPRLVTDASGRARFSFTMPDSLTRWRITGRAMEARGAVGQQVAWLRSDKAFYGKWTSPDWQREGDRAQATLALFNQTGKEAKLEWELRGSDVERKESINAMPGVNFITVALPAAKVGAATLSLSLKHDGRVVDQLETTMQRLPVAWRAPRQLMLDISSGSAALKLPADATRVRVSFAPDVATGEFNRWIDGLIDFPYGCVEQTSSRLISLSIALQSLSPAQQSIAPMLTQRLSTARLALAQMAGPQAQFGWWGRGMEADAFVTTYAYYADWRAAQALRTQLPDEHWQRLLYVYAKGGSTLPQLQRALMLSWMQEMGLPISPMLNRLLEQLREQTKNAPDSAKLGGYRGSLAMLGDDGPDTRDLALVLAAHTAGLAKLPATPEQTALVDAAAARLGNADAPLVKALLMLTRRLGTDAAGAVLNSARADLPTIDRALTLVWTQRALNQGSLRKPGSSIDIALPAPWQRDVSAGGAISWRLPATAALPATLALPEGAKAAWAFVSFESSEAQAPTLPAQIERRLWRLIPDTSAHDNKTAQPGAGRAAFILEPVDPSKPLDTTALYLDEIEVTAQQAMRWTLIEAALPPGAMVENGTWGISVLNKKGMAQLDAAQHQNTAQGYAVPIDRLQPNKAVTVRHLVRFAQRGQFKLPPARLHRMYQPEAKAIEGKGRVLTVDIR